MITYIIVSYVLMILNAVIRKNQIDRYGIPASNIIMDIALAPLTFPILILGWIVSFFSWSLKFFIKLFEEEVSIGSNGTSFPMKDSITSNELTLISAKKKNDEAQIKYALKRRDEIFELHINDEQLDEIIEATKSNSGELEKIVYTTAMKHKEQKK